MVPNLEPANVRVFQQSGTGLRDDSRTGPLRDDFTGRALGTPLLFSVAGSPCRRLPLQPF